MKRMLGGFLEVTAGLAIFVALLGSRTGSPVAGAYYQRQAGGLIQWITIGIGVLSQLAGSSGRRSRALVARLRLR